MHVRTIFVLTVTICVINQVWAKAVESNTNTQLLHRILSALDLVIQQQGNQHVQRELEADDDLDNQLEDVAKILIQGRDKKLANRMLVEEKGGQTSPEEDIGEKDSELTAEHKEMVKKLIVSLVKKTKHCGPLGKDEICADSHDCCCGFTCWKWRCRDMQQSKPNWWELLHNHT